jgi:hypothetical protein
VIPGFDVALSSAVLAVLAVLAVTPCALCAARSSSVTPETAPKPSATRSAVFFGGHAFQ